MLGSSQGLLPAPNVLEVLPKQGDLRAIFMPRNIAIIGATEKLGSVGHTILHNLLDGTFKGEVYPVNPNHDSIMGIKSYPTVHSISEAIDLAVIITPAPTVPNVVKECIEAGVQGSVIISAGFKETGPAGLALEKEILEHLHKSNMRIIGPNCFGVMNPRIGLNATFSSAIARPGNVGFISQSGALGSAIIDQSIRENIGYSLFASIGSMMDVNWSDLISFFAEDPQTENIIIYMESIGNARAFLDVAREVTKRKPIIVIKPGKTKAGATAATSHTGSLAGSDEVFEAAFKQCGVIRVNEISDLFSLSELFAKQPRPKGPRLTILTNAGGPAVLATDTLILGGGKLVPLSNNIKEKLDQILPNAWSHNNPVDILGDADATRYSNALNILVNDPESDGLLVILAPQAMTLPTKIAKAVIPHAQLNGKPILTSWIGGDSVEQGTKVLNAAGIPTFEYPEIAVKMFNYMWQYTAYLQSIMQSNNSLATGKLSPTSHPIAEMMLTNIKEGGRTLLTEFEAKELLHIYGIPTVPTQLASTEDEAVVIAESFGYPVVLKLNSQRITHKSEVGGVRLNLINELAVRKAFNDIKQTVLERTGDPSDFKGVTIQPMIFSNGYEVILGSHIDQQFGTVFLFGTGGELVELYKDRAIALPPISLDVVQQMMKRTLIYKALRGIRGKKSQNIELLEQLILRFSQLVIENPSIKEIEINPLLVSDENIIALDARARLK